MTTVPVTPLETANLPRVESYELPQGVTPLTLITIGLAMVALVLGIAFGSGVTLAASAIVFSLAFAFYDADKTRDAAVTSQRK